jgi:tetratricopeptide (TPR) repeat protein
MALAQFMNRNYTEVVRMSWTSTLNGMVVLAAAYTLLERPEEATEWVKKLLDINPDFNLSQLKLTLLRYYQLEENRTRLYNAAKKAGIPEFPKSQ